MKRLRNISKSDINSFVMYCENCDFQLGVNQVSKPYCPECNSNLLVSIIDNELIDLIK